MLHWCLGLAMKMDTILHFGCIRLLGTVATRIIPVLVGHWPLINVETCGKPELAIAGMHAKDSPVRAQSILICTLYCIAYTCIVVYNTVVGRNPASVRSCFL